MLIIRYQQRGHKNVNLQNDKKIYRNMFIMILSCINLHVIHLLLRFCFPNNF